MSQLILDSSTVPLLPNQTVTGVRTHRGVVEAAEIADTQHAPAPPVVSDESCRRIRIDAIELYTRRTERRTATLQGLLAQHVACLCVVGPVAVTLGMPVVIVISYAGGVLGTSAWLLLYGGVIQNAATARPRTSCSTLNRPLSDKLVNKVESLLELGVMFITIGTVVAIVGLATVFVFCT